MPDGFQAQPRRKKGYWRQVASSLWSRNDTETYRRFAQGMDDRGLRHRGHQGRVVRAVGRRISARSRNNPAQGGNAALSTGASGAGRWVGRGGDHKGCRRRSGRDAWRADHRAGRSLRRGGGICRRRRRRDCLETGPADWRWRGCNQSGAAPDDAGSGGRDGRAVPPKAGCPDHGIGAGRSGTGEKDVEPEVGDRRRYFNSGNDRHSAAVFLLGLDCLNPSRDRRGAGGSSGTCSGLYRLHVRSSRAKAVRIAGSCDAGHGRFQRRIA